VGEGVEANKKYKAEGKGQRAFMKEGSVSLIT
jgi:hypothetical protein